MSAPRFHLIDRQYPGERAGRFRSARIAARELRAAVPAGRFYVLDRETGLALTMAELDSMAAAERPAPNNGG